jgi:hypothetical protein
MPARLQRCFGLLRMTLTRKRNAGTPDGVGDRELPEPVKDQPPLQEEAAPQAGAVEAVAEAPAQAAPKRRPARRPSKPDAVLAEAIDAARAGVLQVADLEQVGPHLGVFPEAERLVTHRFAADVRGYHGWQWFATLARAPRSKEATLCEVGLLPSGDSLLAPDWVPWAERVRPEDAATEAEAAPEAEADTATETGTAEDESHAGQAVGGE